MRSRPRAGARASLGALVAFCAVACAPAVEKIALEIGQERFDVEVARTDAQRARGLMGRAALGPREGMLFVFDRDQHLEFWMKDTLIPLSIAFLSADGKILEIVDLTPFSEKVVRSRFSSRYALELRQGGLREIGAAEGSFVLFPAGFR
jgi:uncharacterized membrane protein (UPF0127 family)